MRSLRIHLKRDYDVLASRYICIYLILNTINSVFQDVFQFTGRNLTIVKVVIAAIIFFFMLSTCNRLKRWQWKALIFAELAILLAFLYSIFAGVALSALSAWVIDMFVVCAPLACFIAFINDKNVLYQKLIKTSWILLFLLTVNLFGQTGSNYDHHFSYCLLLVILLHINELYKGKKKIYIAAIVAEMIMMMAHGARGAVFGIAAFIILKILTHGKTSRRFLYMGLLGAFAAFIYMYLDKIINALYLFLRSQGFKGRSLQLLMNGEFLSHDSGRLELWELVTNLIKQRSLTGWGLRGAVERMEHPYPHNFFLDLVLTFGVPLGICLIIALLWPVRKVVTYEEGAAKDIMQIFFSCSFIMLMFSSTLFTNYYYFLFIGLAFSLKKRAASRSSDSSPG